MFDGHKNYPHQPTGTKRTLYNCAAVIYGRLEGK